MADAPVARLSGSVGESVEDLFMLGSCRHPNG
jgi:hypothetical protein